MSQHQHVDQPLQAYQILVGDRLVALSEVEELIGRKKSFIYAEIAAGRFPAPADGRWSFAEVQEWIRAQLQKRSVGRGVGSSDGSQDAA